MQLNKSFPMCFRHKFVGLLKIFEPGAYPEDGLNIWVLDKL